MFTYSFKVLAKRLALLLLFYQVFRLCFYFFNRSTFEAASTQQTLLAFLHGLRFDLSALFVINLPFIALSIIPPDKFLQKKVFQKWLFVLYIIVNIPFFFLNLIDIEYFKFISRRTTNELFTITQDVIDQSGQLMVHYWWLFMVLLIILYGLYKLYPVYNAAPINRSTGKLQKIVSLIILIPVIVIGIRGGIQYKPLRINHAYIHTPAELGNVALNSTFTFIRSIDNVTLERKDYFESQEEIAGIVNFNPYQYAQVKQEPIRDNVVILIVESLASEYTGIDNDGIGGYTPFLDSLAQEGIFLGKNYANGKRSILAVPSIMAGLPSLMEDPFISSNYETNQIFGIGDILKPAGYTTSFFHGGANGTMGFDSFTKQIGIDNYYGLNEYPEQDKKRDYDGLWGIFDEPYLQYVSRTLSGQKEPFAATVFTLSSHDPYVVPEQHAGKFPKGKLEIHEVLGYADYALKQFFKTASKQPWYQNTLFIITGDHTQKTSRRGYNNSLAMFKVPLILFHPSNKFPRVNTDQVTQHVDILPTIVDYLNIETDKLLPFGRSILDTTRKDKAIFYTSNYTILVHNDFTADLWPDEKTVSLNYFSPHNYIFVHNPIPFKLRAYETEVKAYVQYFRNGLIDNNLYYWINDKNLNKR